ncbi:hypothetical protein E2P81_ATG03753 [Venturia nashicola]|nr:hypothetical protein E2P81_ATG03753 [Venturia nashicola]
MKFTATSFFLLAAPLVSAGCLPPTTPPATTPPTTGSTKPVGWVYIKADVIHKGEHSTQCHNDKLHQTDKWQWNFYGENDRCKLYMYGDIECTGKDGFNFVTRGAEDHGHAHTDHLAWQVKCT